MKLFARYLKYRAKIIITCIAVAGIFASSYFLFDLQAIAVLYPVLLTLCFGLIAAGFDFAAFAKRHNRLKDNPEDLPIPKNLLEEDYQTIINLLREEASMAEQKASEDYTGMIEYYTVWVHQIKTPISVLDMLLKDDTPEMRACRIELFRIEQYVDMVLNYFRLGSDSKDLAYKEIELDSLIKSCIRKYAPLFINKKLKMSYEPVSFKILTDEKWLSFIIEQLLSNAVKYTNEGTVSIKVTDNAIKISDTGIGIRSEDLPRIFEKGYKGFNGRSGSKSSGLGLYLCSMAAKRLSLKLSVTSEPGIGSEFTIDGLFDKKSGSRIE